NVQVPPTRSRAKHRFRLVHKDEDKPSFFGLFASGLEDLAHDALSLTQPHIEDLRAGNRHEIFLDVSARVLGIFLGEVVCGRLADERLSTAGRAEKQDSLDWLLVEALEQLRI